MKINKKYAVDFDVFHKYNFDKGMIFYELNCNLDLEKKDHNPSFSFYLVLFNYIIFDLHIYNMYHLKGE